MNEFPNIDKLEDNKNQGFFIPDLDTYKEFEQKIETFNDIEQEPLEFLSNYNLIQLEKPEICQILADLYNIPLSQLKENLRQDQKQLFSTCKNKYTSGGIPTNTLNAFNGLTDEKGYCFDLYDLLHRFEKGDFLNPFTGKYFTKEFVLAFQSSIQNLYSKSNQIQSLKQIIQSDSLQRLKINQVLLRMGIKNELERQNRIQTFLNLKESDLDLFISTNLKQPEILNTLNSYSEKQKYAIDSWILKIVMNLTEREKASSQNPLEKLYLDFKSQ